VSPNISGRSVFDNLRKLKLEYLCINIVSKLKCNLKVKKKKQELNFVNVGMNHFSVNNCVGISHKAVLLREPAKLALFRATTNMLPSDHRLANQHGEWQRRSPFVHSWLTGRV
jgi:hypothetical protein